MPVNAIVLDIDGTLVGPRGIVVPCVNKALRKSWSEAVIVLASGRPASGLLHVQDQIGRRGEFIALNGAIIGDRAGKLHALSRPFSTSIVKSLLEACARLKSHIRAIYGYSPDQWLAYGSVNAIEKEAAVTCSVPHVCPNEKALFCGETLKATVVCTNDAISRGLCASMKVSMGGFCHVEQSIPRYIEITRFGVSKGRALSHFRRLNGWSNVVSVGDGNNDISMFEAANVSFAMPWASKAVKHAANHVLGKPGHENLAKLILANAGY